MKHLALAWLGECLAANAGRGKMWTSQMAGMGLLAGNTYASDGFMLNVGSMLLRFCSPITDKPDKMAKVGVLVINEFLS